MNTLNEHLIENDLKVNGFTHLKSINTSVVEETIKSLGTIIQETEIKENCKSSRLLCSNQAMELHTDHYAARYIAWFCRSQSAVGGESLLIDNNEVLGRMPVNCIQNLKKVKIAMHRVFQGDKEEMRLLSIENSRNIVYYAPWLTQNPCETEVLKALNEYRKSVKLAIRIKILLSEGDLLIIDNHRMLHGREAFLKQSNRWLTRFWIK